MNRPMPMAAPHLASVPEVEPVSAPAAEAPPRRGRASRWVPGFVVFELLCAVLLLVPELASSRMLLRGGAFGVSLALLAMLRGRGGRHPAWLPAMAVMAIMVLAYAHPDTANPVSGAAQAGLYLAVLAPLFWIPRLQFDKRVLRHTMFILWAFHSASAALGVLQVYFPGHFQPHISDIITSKGKGYLLSLTFITSTGARVYRPMGLFDVPGAAAVSAMYAILLGTGFLLTRKGPWNAAVAIGSMGVGMTCMYLSQVRSALVMTLVALAALAAILVWRREVGRLARLAAVVGAIMVGGYTVAMTMAGPVVARRLGTLTVSRPGQVYYHNRGHFLQDVFTQQLPAHPFGQGLGHWGMMASYFGQPGDAGESVWVEVQWAGWAADGGYLLIAAYVAAMVAALYAAVQSTRRARTARDDELAFWGAVVLAYCVGLCALTFSYPVFIGQAGMEFWLLNATLFVAARSLRKSEAAAPVTAAAMAGTPA